ncbi:hypothetical protein [Rariglobus hedericola]|uniref:Uncharacterized protein n=1 Tax=Rariglobus hedericola TaxID=2597822 RepID=A0A556QMA9_9BACT|nr:hypothetical protein [Rariglobus hedericola]TSJ77789.1 hypothetical protein FPL22_00335 [Rariglobus hedericola]
MNHPLFDAYSVTVGELITYTPAEIGSFRLYGFEYIDNLNFLRTPEEIIPDETLRKRLVHAVGNRFTEAGWEGTGKLSMLWIPPFVFPMAAKIGPLGVIVWHVKQHEDGLSWLLSPTPLPFEEFGA